MSLGPAYQVGDLVPYHFSAGLIVASYFVSLVGSITTVELLHRRTNGTGWLNWLELAGCSTSMALVGIWAMHYIGNRAIVMGDGSSELQLVYNAGFTALSVFVPVGVLLIAFLIAGMRLKGKKTLPISLVVSGILSGLAVVGMHYIGNLGIRNYSVVFSPSHIAGAVIIACVSCVAVLSLFFMLQDLWLDKFLYRLLCAVIIAIAVTGMHFEASVATQYQLQNFDGANYGGRNTNIIIATVLAVLTIPVCFLIGYVSHKRKKALVDRAQQVILACAWFDRDGRLLVTPEGHMPSQKITIQHNQMAFDDEFNVSHPAFQWIFRVTHNWASIAEWVPTMRRHLQSLHFLESPGRGLVDTGSSWEAPEDGDYSIIFRESFCVAAEDLASSLREDCKNLGTLYPGVMMSGTVSKGPHLTAKKAFLGYTSKTATFLRKVVAKSTCMDPEDLEANTGVELFGKGQVLFLVRQLAKKESQKIQDYGFRFAGPEKVIPLIASQLQVQPRYFSSTLNELREASFAENACAMTGTYVGLFALRAGVAKRSWEILVDKHHPDRLPCVELSKLLLSAARLKMLDQLDGMSVTACLAWLAQKEASVVDENTGFWRLFQDSIYQLASLVQEPFFRNAIFSAKLIRLAKSDQKDDQPVNCTILAFHIIPDVHSSSLKSLGSEVTYAPLSFFRCRQQVLPDAYDNGLFGSDVHHEFATLHATKPGPKGLTKAASTMKPKSESEASVEHKDSISSTTRLAPWVEGKGCQTSTPQAGPTLPFGGILVSSDVMVQTEAEVQHQDAVSGAEEDAPMKFMAGNAGATRAHAYTLTTTTNTYVDELFELAVAKWRKYN